MSSRCDRRNTSLAVVVVVGMMAPLRAVEVVNRNLRRGMLLRLARLTVHDGWGEQTACPLHSNSLSRNW